MGDSQLFVVGTTHSLSEEEFQPAPLQVKSLTCSELAFVSTKNSIHDTIENKLESHIPHIFLTNKKCNIIGLDGPIPKFQSQTSWPPNIYII